MALIVFPYRRSEAGGSMHRLDGWPPSPHTEVFGTDGSRVGLWGHEIVREVGLELLPRLATADLHVHPEQFSRLERDLDVLERELRRIAEATEHRHDWIARRAANLRAALKLAREAGEGACVYIGTDDLAAAGR